MGYCITVECNGVRIAKKNVKKALEAINAIPVKEQGHYSWVNHTGKFTDLCEAINEWRYEAGEEKNGDVVIEYFNGEKAGDCDTLYRALGPWINKGAEIIYRGEDGYTWRYYFNGKKMDEQTGKVVWE